MARRKKKKGYTLGALSGIAVIFVVLAVVIAMGAKILGDMQSNEANATGYPAEIMGEGIGALRVFGDWFGTIAIVVIAAVIIGIIIVYFGRYGRSGTV